MTGEGPSIAGTVDPIVALRARLQLLYRQNGELSTRTLAKRTSGAISHTTVSAVLHCRKCPKWGPLELIVEALGGDIDEFRRLWITVRDAEQPLEWTGAGSIVDHDEKNKSDSGVRANGDGLATIPVILATTMGTSLWDVELPVDIVLSTIIRKLIDSPLLPFEVNDALGRLIQWRLMWREGDRILSGAETLRTAGCGAGDTLIMSGLARG